MKTLDKIFLTTINLAPIWIFALLLGVVLNGSTNTGMNAGYWAGSAWFGDALWATYLGAVLVIYGLFGVIWNIIRIFIK